MDTDTINIILDDPAAPGAEGQPPERHRYPRHSGLCPCILIWDGQEAPCDLLNLSMGGAKIRLLEDSPQTQARGAEILLRVPNRGDLPAKVVWHNGNYLGLFFTGDTSDRAEVFCDFVDGNDQPDERREHVRKSVIWSGRVEGEDRSVKCRILDVAIGGAKVQLLEPWDYLGEANLIIDRLCQFSCKVVWCDDLFLGLRFHDAPDDVVEVLGENLRATEEDQ